MSQRFMHLSPAADDSAIRLLDQPFVLQSRGGLVETGRVSEGELNGWTAMTSGASNTTARRTGSATATSPSFKMPTN